MIGELTKLGLNRVPIVSSEGHPLYIVHRSMIERFIVNHALFGTEGKNPGDLTLADLLADPAMKGIFETTFAVVNRRATLAEAKSAMLGTPGCLDVFATAGGSLNEPLLGWAY